MDHFDTSMSCDYNILPVALEVAVGLHFEAGPVGSLNLVAGVI